MGDCLSHLLNLSDKTSHNYILDEVEEDFSVGSPSSKVVTDSFSAEKETFLTDLGRDFLG